MKEKPSASSAESGRVKVKHTTGGKFGDPNEETEVKVLDREIDEFITAAKHADTQGIQGQIDIFKNLIQAQGRQGMDPNPQG